MKKIQHNSRPVSADIHLKYICHECGSEHWISLKENKTPDYKIVCYSCDSVILPETIHLVELKFKQKKEAKSSTPTPIPPKTDPVLDIVQRCAITLASYGFDKQESIALAEKAFIKYNTDNVSELVKKIIFDFGAINEPKTSKV
jgi:DNA-directed RNA polymerase subunit RPC12/RpoP